MDTLTVIAVIAALAVIAGLAWAGGFNTGMNEGIDLERNSSERRVKGLLSELNKLKPRATRKRRPSK